ncbi:aromatic ring-hydroxylating dioxygenase subunit alpha [Rhodococcus fascians]|nr:aromatic ring-hydroxylating dioxygenase subunit alpha [Rhodococcus fascians]MBY3826504.1 aromatic ring-hydroxylating dioxygenase subunit alpha [Rhodococcus fascians]MBY3836965.1 aromatic ring-hydroxylating dioxygenase subunit alpha [Rhodococcus fascians]MBY3865568.1 aromatic ring-hydroxylating dioxygenase subunit alpha [Rhodococcus fascians]MBY3885647.1 aromatic ring-hydroxylating dioxygenase subunit alpha [Rhodococcus fascians]
MTTAEPSDLADWVQRTRQGIAEGRFPARAFNDRSVYDLEQKHLFSRAWCFLAHESEIPSAGDYVTRFIGNNSIIVARGEDGTIHANLNMCRHRGNVMCKSEMGNSSHFRCSFHGWTYKNTGRLIGVPYMKEGYEGRLERKDWAMVPVRIDSYEGLIFGTLDPESESLGEFLGDFRFYLDLYLKHGEQGCEVHGPPDHWLANTDWKICAENFAGDGYHTPVAHQWGFHLGYFPSSGSTHSQGWAASIPGRGHGVGLGHSPNFPPFAGFPPELAEEMKSVFSAEQTEVFSKVRTAVGTVFPNLSFLMQPFSLVPGEPGVRFVTMRLYHPVGPGRMEMYSWCLVPKGASKEYKNAAYRAYTLAFGQAGTFEQDDFENWAKVTRSAASTMVADVDFPYSMGMDSDPDPDFAGPGHVVTPYVNDTNFRNLWSRWGDYLADEV